MKVYRAHWKVVDWDLVYTGANCIEESGYTYGKTKEEALAQVPAVADESCTEVMEVKVPRFMFKRIKENYGIKKNGFYYRWA